MRASVTVLKYEFRPLPQVNSLSLNETNKLHHLHRQYVNQRLSSQVNSLTVIRQKQTTTAFRTVFNRSLLDVVAQFGQHNGGLVRRNSLLRDPGSSGHFGQWG